MYENNERPIYLRKTITRKRTQKPYLCKMAHRILAMFLFIGLLLSSSSCGMHYASVAPSAPLLERSGDLSINASVSSGTGWSGSVAFAPLDQLSLVIEGSTLGGNSDTINSMSQFYQSVGAGIGTHFHYTVELRGDVYLGFAKGTSLFDGHGGMIGIISDSGKTNFTSYFAQSAIGLCIDPEDLTDILGLQIRLSYLNFNDYFSLLQYRNGDPDDREMFAGHGDVLVAEQSLFIRVGPPNYKMTGFITLPRTIFGKTDDLFIEGAIGVGLELRLNFYGERAQ
jgi:hypothetical protein